VLLVKSNFCISIFKTIAPLPAAIASQPVSGELSGNLAINLNTFAVEGAIARPAIGTIKGDSVGQLGYANGVTLTAVSLLRESRYALAGGIYQSKRSSIPRQGQNHARTSRKRLDCTTVV